jgi:DNA-binding transcriptional LysR family regulator
MDREARLRAFAAFAQRRSFSAAARELRISQPAVSNLLPEVLVAFQRAHPAVRVSLLGGPSAQTMDALRAHHADPPHRADELGSREAVRGPWRWRGRLQSVHHRG